MSATQSNPIAALDPWPGAGSPVDAGPVAVASRRTAMRRIVCAALVGGAIAFGQLPLLVKFLRHLADRGQYQFFPLLFLAAGVLAVERLRDVPPAQVRRGSWRVAVALLGLALLIAFVAAVFFRRWLAGPAALLTLAGVTWRLGGPRVGRALLPAGLLLLVVIPPPESLDVRLTQGLRSLAVAGSSRLLDAMGVLHVRAGSTIDLPGHQLLVEEACSGINSLVTVVAFTLLLGLLMRRRPLALAALLIVAVAFVVWANVARITLGAVLQASVGVDILRGDAHGLAGAAIFITCLLLVASTDRLLPLRPAARGPARPGRFAQGSADASAAAPFLAAPGPAWWGVALASLALGLFAQPRLADCWRVAQLPGNPHLQPPLEVAGWRLVPDFHRVSERAHTDGKYCHRWLYRDADGLTAEVLLAYPFTTHDPAGCYRLAGWSMSDRQLRAGPAPYGEGQMHKGDNRLGFLLNATFDEGGAWHAPVASTEPMPGWADRWIWRAGELPRRLPRHDVQTFIATTQPLAEPQKARARALFEAVRDELRSQALTQIMAGGRP